MRKFIAYHIVEAGKVLGCVPDRITNKYQIAVDLGDNKHEIVQVSQGDFDYDKPAAGNYLLRGVKGQIQIMSSHEFEEAHAELFPHASSAKSFKVQDD